MKQGRTLTELAAELDRQQAVKEDFIAPTSKLWLTKEGLEVGDDGHYPVLPLAHQQIGQRVGIPSKYYNKMMEQAPELLNTNVNHWFQSAPENRMLRLMDNKVRAFLSDQYLRRDNHELMQFVIPTLADIGGLQVASCEVTDHNLYLKVITPRIQGEVRKGDVVQAGVMFANSEVGLGAYKIHPFLNRVVCDNGMVIADYGMKKYHVGKRISADGIRYLSDEAIQADDEAFFLMCRDMVANILTEATFNDILNQLVSATDSPIEVKPMEAVERLSKKYSMNQNEHDNVLMNLLRENDLTQYGMMNAVTQSAKEDELTYDRASELEALGGTILTLSDSEWRMIAA